MHITSIKLSGFKSFAEPAVLETPGRMIGIVGPNGCGKSNVIDAVRWVLGETRAAELRGETMQDLIFNGTDSRKPSSRASVELVFDNSSQRIGGPWADYQEISVRRVLTRDGASSYFINGQAVRRRDVHDMFLGTGLGPRAYAIIGQGMISRILESRPEDLRVFLEEAAGVSKYKERRRETEGRLQDTRENLTRVEDILRELTSALEKLEAQAQVAAQYHELQAQATSLQQRIWWLSMRQAQQDSERIGAQAQKRQTELQAAQTQLQSLLTELEQLRQAGYTARDERDQGQQAYFAAQSEVSRLEQEQSHRRMTREQWQQQIDALTQREGDWRSKIESAQTQARAVDDEEQQAREASEELSALVDELGEQLPVLEAKATDAQLKVSEHKVSAATVLAQSQALSAQLESQARQLRQTQQELDVLHERARQVQVPDAARLQQLEQQLSQADEALALTSARQEELAEQGATLEATEHEARQAQHDATTRLTQLQERLQVLRALQDQLEHAGKLWPWLAKHGLEGKQALWRRVHIEPGWETALEAVLRERMGALEVGRLDQVQAFASDAPPAKLSFFCPPTQQDAPAQPQRTLYGLLKVSEHGLDQLLRGWLRGVFVAESLEAALQARAQLGAGEVWVTRSGHVVDAVSVSFYAAESEQSGLLARAQEIENLERELKAAQLMEEGTRTAQARAQARLSDWRTQAAQLEQQRLAATHSRHELEVACLRQREQVRESTAQSEQLREQQDTLRQRRTNLQSQQDETQARFDELETQLGDAQQLQADLEADAMAANQLLNAHRQRLRQEEQRAQESGFRLRSLAQKREDLQRAAQEAEQQATLCRSQAQALGEQLAQLAHDEQDTALQAALARRVQAEETLTRLRQQEEDLHARFRARDEERLQHELQLEPLRQSITESQLKQQEAQLRAQQFVEQLQAAGVDMNQEPAFAEPSLGLTALQKRLSTVQESIAALGAVNLAALEELTESRQRQQFLHAQADDLRTASQTLEQAIRKMDGETREMLQATFDQVNAQYGRIFPELFGGGQARLVMTGEEVLDAGVQVWAQPPGKKNSTIHLLSGGEKALTAIALVFAIFQLNPAPFCLLDEVDAALDDVNTVNYCKMVQRMSSRTQFVFISHNKVAMEVAEQLVGVTAEEKGVSRIVAVDMQAAMSLAALV